MSDLIGTLREGRSRELVQALFYRFLAADAEEAGDAATAERLNDLLADEQHHVSRLTARLLELGEKVGDQRPDSPQVPSLETWEVAARTRETQEVAWYEEALAEVDDPSTRAILSEILASERQHRDHLGGKWMAAGHGHDTEPTEGKEGA